LAALALAPVDGSQKPWALMKVDEDAIAKAFFRASITVKVENSASTLF
jgi:hypothetical protein